MHKISWAPSWIHLPLPLVQKSISFFFKERPHKAIPALFLSVFSLLRFSLRDKTYFQTSQLVPLEVWSFSCLLTYGTLSGGTFMEMFVWEKRCSHSTCSTPCPAWSVLPPWLPWISQVLRLCCFSFSSRTSKLPCAGMMGHPKCILPTDSFILQCSTYIQILNILPSQVPVYSV